MLTLHSQVTAHAASFDYYPERRHALRVTPHGERPLSIKEYEEKYGKKAQAWISPAAKAYAAKQNANDAVQNGAGAVRGYSD
jgi:sulfonate dioxygenase